jgi:aminoglycoside/choline kinase family phosphotransferase
MANQNNNFITEEAVRVFKAEVTGIEKLAGDASDRRFYRIRLNGQPQSVIVMELSQPDPDSDLPYITIGRFFKSINLPCPEIYHYNADRGLLFLEDGGTISLFDLIVSDGFNQSYYHQAIDLLLVLQEEGSRKCDWLNVAFDEEKFLWELDFFVEHTIVRYGKLTISQSDRQAFSEEFNKLIQPLLAQPKVLTHRDYHSRNLMVNHNRLTVIDFQDARWGPCQYDLASLLKDSYVKLEEEKVSSLIGYYLEKRRQQYGYDMDSDTFRELFDWMSVQRNLKAIGTFTSQLNLKDNDLYLRFIPTTARYVRDNCQKYPELQRLGELLSTYKVIRED